MDFLSVVPTPEEEFEMAFKNHMGTVGIDFLQMSDEDKEKCKVFKKAMDDCVLEDYLLENPVKEDFILSKEILDYMGPVAIELHHPARMWERQRKKKEEERKVAESRQRAGSTGAIDEGSFRK